MGHKTSPETRAKISASQKARLASPGARVKQALIMAAARERRGQKRFTHTPLHLDLASFLLDAGLELASEVRFGPYSVDLYEPTRHLAFEADGDYYHGLAERARPGYYDRRDAYLLAEHDLPVVRFTEAEIGRLGYNRVGKEE